MTIDKNNKYANWLYDEYKYNLKIWAEEMWKETEVKIQDINNILIK